MLQHHVWQGPVPHARSKEHACTRPAPSSHCRRIHVNRLAARAATLDSPTQQQQQPLELPASLCNNVTCLRVPNEKAPGGTTEVYLLGMSHVSKKSVRQVKELIRLVEPEVVGVELCKDRIPLLIDTENDNSPNIWHCRRIEIDGIPADDPAWPSYNDLKGLLKCQPGQPISTRDMEADCIRLLSTGLFRSARPLCKGASPEDAPAFMVVPTPPQEDKPQQLGSYVAQQQQRQQQQQEQEDGPPDPVRLQLVPPLGVIRYAVQPRVLPPITSLTARIDSSLQGSEEQQQPLERKCAEIESRQVTPFPGEEPLPTLTCLLRARAELAAVFGNTPVVIAFDGVETGRVEVVAKAPKPSDPAFVSGFESSATNGEGLGIDTFNPQKKTIKLSNKMYLPEEALERLKEQSAAAFAATASEKAQALEAAGKAVMKRLENSTPRTSYIDWDRADIDGYAPLIPPPNPSADFLGELMTLLYAKYQTAAARKLGLTPGAAWQAALKAGSEVGSQQLLLVDRPTVVTERKLADALFANSGARMGAALGVVVSSIAGCLATSTLPEAAELGVVAGSFGAAVGLLWPLIGPIIEISQLAEKSPEEIEAAVGVSEPIAKGDLSQPLRLFGEDAILDWPGAMDVVIRDRDAYMARTVAAAATGAAPLSPAYVRDAKDGGPMWRLMVPQGAPAAAAPQGLGDGAYVPMQDAKRVVAVVGTAHVRGMVKEWEAAVREAGEQRGWEGAARYLQC